jgi:hypothetical protein
MSEADQCLGVTKRFEFQKKRLQTADLILEFKDQHDSLKRQALTRQMSNQLKAVKVILGVEAVTAIHSSGDDKPQPVILAERLRMQAAKERSNTSCVDWGA